MPKPFPYKDSHRVPWKYDVTLISTRTGKEKVCSNVSSGLSRLTRSGRCHTLEELEKRRKEIGKSTVEPVRNSVDTIFCRVRHSLDMSLINFLFRDMPYSSQRDVIHITFFNE